MIFKFQDNSRATHYMDVQEVVTIGFGDDGYFMAEAYDGGASIISYNVPVEDEKLLDSGSELVNQDHESFFVIYPKQGRRFIVKVRCYGAAWLMNNEGKTIENIAANTQVKRATSTIY